ncbi:MAG: 30S ribosomal protein S1, partial [Oscillospiraceae bacterium]|nr:30S ribosomal protein S1 [Oscillospiraceae bacterium]
NGETIALLSRKQVQEACKREYLSQLENGEVIDCKVTHLEQFGCFVDVGCGIASMIPIDAISVSRISHPCDRFELGEDIKAIVKGFDGERLYLSHKELLGTWEENAEMFRAGETVNGIVRSIESYGIFVELAPNLAGLAEPKPDVFVGQTASVYIKSINPGKMKIKLIIVDTFDADPIKDNRYFITAGVIKRWRYSPEGCQKHIESVF